MTDNELAEQFADGYATPDIEPILRMHLYECAKESFLAGLKARELQWHYLTKDPNDLPKEQGQYLVLLDYFGIKYDILFKDEVKMYSPNIIKWCEMPKV